MRIGDQDKCKIRIYVAGDFFWDIIKEGRLEGCRFKQERKSLRLGGGAQNTYLNLQALAARHKDIKIGRLGSASPSAALTKYIANGTTLLESWDEQTTKTGLQANVSGFLSVKQGRESVALVISEYNKGGLNGPRTEAEFSEEVEFAVVDSKYRTVNLKALKNTKVKILRCTSDEYDKEFAANFDWVVWTNHDEEIWLFQPDCINKVTFQVPIIDVVDPCGAGDTFTAALAIYIAKHLDPSSSETDWEDLLSDGVEFAIGCAQDVCRRKYTAVTARRLQ